MTPLGLAIKPGTAARLGIRQPQRLVRPLRFRRPLTVEERERLAEAWLTACQDRTVLVVEGGRWVERHWVHPRYGSEVAE